MAVKLKQAEFLADTLAHKVMVLVSERDNLRNELAQRFTGSEERDKAFVAAYKAAVMSGGYAAVKVQMLGHLLMVR